MSDRLREDFPIDWEEDHFVTRREFFKFLTLASGGVAVGTAALAAYAQLPKNRRQFQPAFVCNVDKLTPGSSLAFSYPRAHDLCLLVRKSSGEFVAYSRRCTHLSCPVEYERQNGEEILYCPCHHGSFSIEDGRVLQGPPPRPIPRIELERREDEIWAVGAYSEVE
ncbi:MAG: Rieske 2Fe-2S domain-containing protein [Armatimonadetes bacterium]|nr:Rieske 2Fe-2S domain-containing protein [Armatimonadota bacterium]